MKIGVADYGMNVWYGGCFDIEQRLADLKAIGFQGIERLGANSASEALATAAAFRRLGMDFGTCRGPDIQTTIRWTSGLGKAYVWANVSGKDFDSFCRQVNHMVEAAAVWGIRVGLHNHMGTLVETRDQLESFLERCPDCGLIFDTAHLAATGGDCMAIVDKYADRLVAVHLKDWLETNPEIGFDRWYQRGRFCGLGKGNIGMDNPAILQAILATGYDGWVFIEHDTHLQDPLVDLAASRDTIADLLPC